MRPLTIWLLILAQANPSMAWGACVMVCDVSARNPAGNEVRCILPAAKNNPDARPKSRCSLAPPAGTNPCGAASDFARKSNQPVSSPCCVRPPAPQTKFRCCAVRPRPDSTTPSARAPLFPDPPLVRTTPFRVAQPFLLKVRDAALPGLATTSSEPCCNCRCSPVDAPDALPPPGQSEPNRHEWLGHAVILLSVPQIATFFVRVHHADFTELHDLSHGRRQALLGSWLK